MNSPRLVDGDKLLECLNTDALELYEKGAIVPSGILVILRDKIESGIFDIPSDQGEAIRLQEALINVRQHLNAGISEFEAEEARYIEALSKGDTEPEGAQRVREMRQCYADRGVFTASNAIEEAMTALGITIPGINTEGEKTDE